MYRGNIILYQRNIQTNSKYYGFQPGHAGHQPGSHLPGDFQGI